MRIVIIMYTVYTVIRVFGQWLRGSEEENDKRNIKHSFAKHRNVVALLPQLCTRGDHVQGVVHSIALYQDPMD